MTFVINEVLTRVEWPGEACARVAVWTTASTPFRQRATHGSIGDGPHDVGELGGSPIEADGFARFGRAGRGSVPPRDVRHFR